MQRPSVAVISITDSRCSARQRSPSPLCRGRQRVGGRRRLRIVPDCASDGFRNLLRGSTPGRPGGLSGSRGSPSSVPPDGRRRSRHSPVTHRELAPVLTSVSNRRRFVPSSRSVLLASPAFGRTPARGGRRRRCHAHLLDEITVLSRVLGRRMSAAAAHAGQGTGVGDGGGAQPWRALPDREPVVDRQHHVLGCLPPAERAEVGGAVVAHRPDHRQPWERLLGDLDPQGALWELGPPVVPRRMAADRRARSRLQLVRQARLDPCGSRTISSIRGASQLR